MLWQHLYKYVNVFCSGQNYVEALRDRLETAVKDQDKRGLEALIYESENACLPELGFEVRKAREMLERLGGGSGGIEQHTIFKIEWFLTSYLNFS